MTALKPISTRWLLRSLAALTFAFTALAGLPSMALAHDDDEVVTYGPNACTAVANLHNLEMILPAVKELGHRHKTYGVTTAHYAPVGAALLWTLVAALALGAFCGLWAWARSVQMDRAMKVRTLHQRRAPELALRRAASS